MAFSDWQLQRLRNALRAYHDYGQDKDGRAFNWKDVTEGIDDAIGLDFLEEAHDEDKRARLVKQFSERLRQFVEGVRRPDGTWHYPKPQDSTIDAIYKFAIHEDYALLSDEELREQAPTLHAALRLREFLHTGNKARALPLAMLEGRYRSKRFEEEDYVVRDLSVLHASGDGIIRLAMNEDSYDKLTGAQFDDLPPKERRKGFQNQTVHNGWAVVTPEDNLMLFLKSADDNANSYYLSLASDLSHSSRSPVLGLALLHYDFLAEVDDGTPLEAKRIPAIATAVGERIWLFERVA